MKKHPVFFVFILIFLITAAAAADSEVLLNHAVSYMCGDTFEISIPDRPSTTSMISRSGSVQAEAGVGERLLLVHVIFRNLTPTVFNGLTVNSFTLKGYVRDRSLTYTPIIFQSYDYTYGSSGSTVTSAGSLTLPPLRQENILLVFQVNPILINWELYFRPDSAKDPEYTFENATYEPMDQQPCEGVFLFTSILNAETGEITKYIR